MLFAKDEVASQSRFLTLTTVRDVMVAEERKIDYSMGYIRIHLISVPWVFKLVSHREQESLLSSYVTPKNREFCG